MLLEILLALFIGIFAGTITGLIPGIHINLIAIFLLSISATHLTTTNPIILITFIISLSITHTFIDFIPSVFLGCPDTDTELSVLPGHQLLQQGKGYEAIILTTYGSLAAILIFTLIIIPALSIKTILDNNYNIIETLIPGLLILSILYINSLEKYKIKAITIILLSGILGYITLNNLTINQPLLPLLTGLFGSSALIIGIKNKTTIPKQELIKPKINSIKPFFGAMLASPLCSFLPGLGAGQAAIIGNSISKTDNKGFLILIGFTNTFVMAFSFITIYLISKTRTGSAYAISQLTQNIDKEIIFKISLIVLINGFLVFFLTQFIAKNITKQISKINYTKLSITTLLILTTTIFLISGFKGFLLFIVSTALGIYSIKQKVKRTNMMGCLMIPTIIWYLF